MYKIEEELLNLERDRYNILNEYILGIVDIKKVRDFGRKIEVLRIHLDKIEVSEDNLYEIASIKSKIQHFYTEIMEDEDLLRVAYSNKS